MAIFGGISQAAIVNNVLGALQAHRNALETLKEVHDWSSGVALADLEALGFSATDAQSVLNAIADGYNEYLIHYGQGAAQSTNVQNSYNFSASSSIIIGPGR